MVSSSAIGDFQSTLDLSILIVTYNSAETIRECVESIIPELASITAEIIIIDNKSSDETPAILGSLADQYSQLQIVINRVNTGFAAGNNQALSQASGENIFILNPDTVLEPGLISGLMDELASQDQIGIVAPQLKFPDGRIQKTCRRFPTHLDVIYTTTGLARLYPRSHRFNGWKMGDFDHQTRCQVDQPAGAALMVDGSLLRSLDGFDSNFPMFFNDVDLCKRVKDMGFEIWYLPEYKVTHLGGISVKQVKIKMTFSSHVSFFRYFEKHFTRLHQQPFNFVIGLLLYLSILPRILFQLLRKNKQDSTRDTL
jgi:N-acetylglucosaminyl-diphospho-decaprenol L-rhamnosyltransferase